MWLWRRCSCCLLYGGLRRKSLFIESVGYLVSPGDWDSPKAPAKGVFQAGRLKGMRVLPIPNALFILVPG
jgi:hypothetical protein